MKLLIIVAGTIFGPLIIFGIIKIIYLVTKKIKPGIGTMSWSVPFVFLWKHILRPKKIILWVIIFFIGYGIYLLVLYCWPTPEKLAFKELSRGQAELELQPEKTTLETLNEKVKKGMPLSNEEKRQAMEASKKIETVRKNYSEGKLTPPPPKKISAKPKEEIWIFAWRASDELMAENNQQKPHSEYVANDVKYSEKELSFVCFKGSKKENKIVLTRGNQEEYYLGYIFNKQKKEYNQIRLLPDDKKNFSGYIFTRKGGEIIATLKKQS